MRSTDEPPLVPFCSAALGALQQYAVSESTTSDVESTIDDGVTHAMNGLLDSLEIDEHSESFVAVFTEPLPPKSPHSVVAGIEESEESSRRSIMEPNSLLSSPILLNSDCQAITIGEESAGEDELDYDMLSDVELVEADGASDAQLSTALMPKPSLVDLLMANSSFELSDQSVDAARSSIVGGSASTVMLAPLSPTLGGTNVGGWSTSAYGPSVPPKVMQPVPPAVESTPIMSVLPQVSTILQASDLPPCSVRVERVPDSPIERERFVRRRLKRNVQPTSRSVSSSQVTPAEHTPRSGRRVQFVGGDSNSSCVATAPAETVQKPQTAKNVRKRESHSEPRSSASTKIGATNKTSTQLAQPTVDKPSTSGVPGKAQKRLRAIASLLIPAGNDSAAPSKIKTPKAKSVPAKKSTKEQTCKKTKESSKTQARAKSAPRRRRVIVEEDDFGENLDDESGEEAESTDNDANASPSPPPVSPPAKKRSKGPSGRLRTEQILSRPKSIFPQALFPAGSDPENQGGRSRIYVPPSSDADRNRKRKSAAALATLVTKFCSAQSDTVILFETLQHDERIQIVRKLLPIAFMNDFNVEPLLRLMKQNCSRVDDPLTGIVGSLDFQLIGAHQATHTSNAHAMLFLYTLPLFLQRWGIMSFATTSVDQWSTIGQHYYNWSQVNRWPELLIVAPEETLALIKVVLADKTCTLSEKFQIRMGELFAKQTDLVRRWWFTRRCAFNLRDDTTGRSLGINILVTQTANWLQSLSPKNVRKGIMAAEDMPISSSLVYPAPEIYQATIPAITAILANANPSSAHLQLVRRSVLAAQAHQDSQEWVTFSGGDQPMQESFTALQACTPEQTVIVIDTRNAIPELAVQSLWKAPDGQTTGSFGIRFPILDMDSLREQLNAIQASTSAGASVDESAKETSNMSTIDRAQLAFQTGGRLLERRNSI